MPPLRVGFLGLFGLKTGINFAHFGLESGMVFEGTIRECIGTYLSFQFQINEKERNMGIRSRFENFFVCVLVYVMKT